MHALSLTIKLFDAVLPTEEYITGNCGEIFLSPESSFMLDNIP